MGRGRVELKRIENKINRQVTFSKRRSGLVKKAKEISVLCDAEVALIVFSTKGKLFHFSSDPCMERILEQYERYSYAERQVASNDLEPNCQENWTLQHAKLKARIEVLQRNQRHFMGEDLEGLSLKELQNLEHQLESALKHIRSRKNRLMNESISDLQKRDKGLQEENNVLAKKIKEREKAVGQQQNNQGLDDSSVLLTQQPLLPLNIIGGSRGEGMDYGGNVNEARPNNTMLPAWMLRPLHE
ncbi:hypothetical protein K1719_029848 [Acacia pycnantha]|nr:hypothetical protein K1719_029848 [Acacia pycnantha]